MIVGRFRNREARVRLTLRGLGGRKQSVVVVIDTGYTSTMTLPRRLIESLRLPWDGVETAILGDGSVCRFSTYRAQVRWHGRWRDIIVDEADSEPLIGLTMLEECALTVHVREGGTVRIARLK